MKSILYFLLIAAIVSACTGYNSKGTNLKPVHTDSMNYTPTSESITEKQLPQERPDNPDQNRPSNFVIRMNDGNSRQSDLTINRKSDFMNASFFFEFESDALFKMKNGVCNLNVDFGIDELSLIKSEMINENGNKYYLVLLDRVIGGGSSYSIGCLKVFKQMIGRKYHEIACIGFSDETEQVLTVSENEFEMHASHWGEHDGACCPSIKEIGKFEIGNGNVIRKSSRFEWMD